MRSLRMATCTSGDPVSPSCFLYELMTSVLRSLLSTGVPSTGRPESAGCGLPDGRKPCGHKELILAEVARDRQNRHFGGHFLKKNARYAWSITENMAPRAQASSQANCLRTRLGARSG